MKNGNGYSELETKLLSILKGGKQFTISQLSDKAYRNAENIPRYDREVIRGTLDRLGSKLKKNREGVNLWKSERRGPHEVSYWLE